MAGESQPAERVGGLDLAAQERRELPGYPRLTGDLPRKDNRRDPFPAVPFLIVVQGPSDLADECMLLTLGRLPGDERPVGHGDLPREIDLIPLADANRGSPVAGVDDRDRPASGEVGQLLAAAPQDSRRRSEAAEADPGCLKRLDPLEHGLLPRRAEHHQELPAPVGADDLPQDHVIRERPVQGEGDLRPCLPHHRAPELAPGDRRDLHQPEARFAAVQCRHPGR